MINKYPYSCDSSGPAAKTRLIKPPIKSIHPCRCGEEAIIKFKLRTPLNDEMHFIQAAGAFQCLIYYYYFNSIHPDKKGPSNCMLSSQVSCSRADWQWQQGSVSHLLHPLMSFQLSFKHSSLLLLLLLTPPWLLITINIYGSQL